MRTPGERRARDEAGFTLIELMVVVLIIAVLVAIGLPSYLGAKRRAHDGAAKALTRQALSAELVYYGSAREFTDDPALLDAIEPDLAWGTLAASDKGAVAHVPEAQTAILRSESSTGTIFCMGRIALGAGAGTYYTTGCTGAEARADVAAWPSTIDAGW